MTDYEVRFHTLFADVQYRAVEIINGYKTLDTRENLTIHLKNTEFLITLINARFCRHILLYAALLVASLIVGII